MPFLVLGVFFSVPSSSKSRFVCFWFSKGIEQGEASFQNKPRFLPFPCPWVDFPEGWKGQSPLGLF